MIKKIIVASNNKKKIDEIKNILKDLNIEILSLKDIELDIDVEETGKTFKDNALIKALEINRITNTPVLSDDSGLEVFALDKKPGVYSARYAGLDKNDEDNNDLLLKNLKGVQDRSAQYVCAIALVINQSEYYIEEGFLKGEIINERKGYNGFGYDPIFYLKEYNQTTAEISPELKNKISHRAKALEKIMKVLRRLNNEN